MFESGMCNITISFLSLKSPKKQLGQVNNIDLDLNFNRFSTYCFLLLFFFFFGFLRLFLFFLFFLGRPFLLFLFLLFLFFLLGLVFGRDLGLIFVQYGFTFTSLFRIFIQDATLSGKVPCLTKHFMRRNYEFLPQPLQNIFLCKWQFWFLKYNESIPIKMLPPGNFINPRQEGLYPRVNSWIVRACAATASANHTCKVMKNLEKQN